LRRRNSKDSRKEEGTTLSPAVAHAIVKKKKKKTFHTNGTNQDYFCASFWLGDIGGKCLQF
jgi:hypothetical protein